MNKSAKPVVAVLLEDQTILRFLAPLIKKLILSGEHQVLPICKNEDIQAHGKAVFPQLIYHLGYDPAIVRSASIDILITTQNWWHGVIPILLEARNANVPILHFDHGTMLHVSEYLLDGREYTFYRSDLSLCSHVACWGSRGKEVWVSAGVLEEKLFVTGAPQYDELYSSSRNTEATRTKLGLEKDQKVILCFSSLTGQQAKMDEKVIELFERVNEFVTKHPEYRMIIKPHPSEFLWFDTPKYEYQKYGQVIANPIEDCRWPFVQRIEADEVVAVAAVVVSAVSSSLISPLIQNKPIIMAIPNIPYCYDIAQFMRIGCHVADDLGKVGNLIEQAQNEKLQTARLAAQLNFNNDGKATTRLFDLINAILNHRKSNVQFFLPIEQEFEACIRRYPFLPYPYRNLVLHCAKNRDYANEIHWLREYEQRFNNPVSLIEELVEYYFAFPEERGRVVDYLDMLKHFGPVSERMSKIAKQLS